MTLQHINPDDLFAVPVFTQAVAVTDATLVFLSGQVAWDAAGTLVGAGDLEAQLVQVFDNIQTILTALDADFTHVVKLTNYVVDYRPEYREIYGRVLGRYVTLGDKPPASTLLGVQALAAPDLLVEIEAVVAV